MYVNGDWRLIDVLWASTMLLGSKDSEWVLVNVEEIEKQNEEKGKLQHFTNEFFFLTDPDYLAGTHFPDDPQWQLLPRPVSLKRFESYVYVRERFFQLGMHMNSNSQKYCVLKTKNGEIQLGFGFAKKRAPTSNFRYLFYSLKEPTKFDNEVALKQFVLAQKSMDDIFYSIRFPKSGMFRMDIFGQDTEEHSIYDLVCSYVINCSESKANCLPLPDSPDVGWGPTVESYNLGIIPNIDQETIIVTNNGKCELSFTIDESIEVSCKLVHLTYDMWLLQKHVLIHREDDTVTFHIRLPETGEYALKIYACTAGLLSKVTNVCNYLIQAKNVDALYMAFPDIRGGALGKVRLTEHFQVVPISHTKAFVTATDNKITLSMSSEEGVELLAEMCSTMIDSKYLTTRVIRLHSDTTTTFEIDLPKEGEYSLNIFASRNNSPCLFLVYTYLLNYTTEKQSIEEMDIKAKSTFQQSNAESNEEEEEEFDIPNMFIPILATTSREEIDVKVTTRLNTMAGTLECRDYGMTQAAGVENLALNKGTEQSIFGVKLAQQGEYELSLFEEHPPGMLSQFSAYEILRQNGVEDVSILVYLILLTIFPKSIDHAIAKRVGKPY